jgi:hypothetical protein
MSRKRKNSATAKDVSSTITAQKARAEMERDPDRTWSRADKIQAGLLAFTALAFLLNAGLWYTTQQNFRVDRRAWVGAVRALQPTITTGQGATMGAVLTNSGSTPALEMYTQVAMRTVPRGREPDFDLPTLPGRGTRIVLQPGMDLTIPVTATAPLTEQEIDVLRSGEAVIYMYGTIAYQDIFSVGHRTDFCFDVRSDLKTVSGCPFHNTAD